jgi:hypothetical protein
MLMAVIIRSRPHRWQIHLGDHPLHIRERVEGHPQHHPGQFADHHDGPGWHAHFLVSNRASRWPTRTRGQGGEGTSVSVGRVLPMLIVHSDRAITFPLLFIKVHNTRWLWTIKAYVLPPCV